MTLTHHSLSKNYQYVLIGKICVLNLQLNIDTLTLNEVFWKWIYSLKWWNTSYPVMVDIPPNNYNTSRYYRCGRPITEQKKCWELLAEKFDRFQTVQQHATTSKNMQHGVQTDAKCPTMLGVVDQHCCPVPDTTLLGVVTSACTPTTRNIVGATMSGVVASVCTQPKVVLWNSWPHLTWFEWGAIEIAPLV